MPLVGKPIRLRTLYVKKVTRAEVVRQWNGIGPGLNSVYLYVQCTKAGVINWNRNAVYKAEELIERNNVKIVS